MTPTDDPQRLARAAADERHAARMAELRAECYAELAKAHEGLAAIDAELTRRGQ